LFYVGEAGEEEEKTNKNFPLLYIPFSINFQTAGN
jgi:hypothetical protein